MWAVAAQPRAGLIPMIPTPSVDSGMLTARTAQCRLEVHGFLSGGYGVGAVLLGGEAAFRPQQGRGEDDGGRDETGADTEGEVVPAGQRGRGGSAVGEETVGPDRRKSCDDGQPQRATDLLRRVDQSGSE